MGFIVNRDVMNPGLSVLWDSIYCDGGRGITDETFDIRTPLFSTGWVAQIHDHWHQIGEPGRPGAVSFHTLNALLDSFDLKTLTRFLFPESKSIINVDVQYLEKLSCSFV